MQQETIGNRQTELTGKGLSLEDFREILYHDGKIRISDSALSNIDRSYEFLKKFSKEKIIYGINTAFGSMAQHTIGADNQKKLQYNLIRSHCSGSGNPLDPIYVKSVVLARLSTLLLGHSGIHRDVLLKLKELVNNNICPIIYEHGSVGASGDLVQLAHVALCLIGEGEVTYNGEKRDVSQVFAELNIDPIDIHIREGLAILNGTAAMTGIGIVNILQSRILIEWMLVASSIINELVESYDDQFSKELNNLKKHHGQQRVAGILRELAKDSGMIKRREDHLYNGSNHKEILNHKVQEYYSLRCVPQILGPVLDTIYNAEKVLIEEVNSVNDNPIVDVETENVYHGGNFHGDYVSLEMDKLKLVITKLSILSERQLNFLLNNKLNNLLPPYLNLGTLGLNFGMQGMQFTATSTTAENQTLSNPMYVHNIPSNNDNQDVVSMGTNAALLTKKIIENSFEVLSIELIALLQAIDYLGCQENLSSFSKDIYDDLRKVVPKFIEDGTRYKDIKAIKDYIQSRNLNLV